MKKRFTFLIAAIFTLAFLTSSQGVLGQEALSLNDLVFGTPYIDEDFNSLSTCDLTAKHNPFVENFTSLGAFNYVYNNNTDNHYGIYSNTTFKTKALKVAAGSSSQVIVGITKKGSSSVQFEDKGAFTVKFLKTDKCYFGLYSSTSSQNAMSKNDVSVFITNNQGVLTIHNGASSNNNQSIGTYSTDSISICVIYNNSEQDATYGNNISIGAKNAHVYVNNTCVMDGQNPKAFTIPGRSLTMFRAVPMTTSGYACTLDDLKIYNSLPTAPVAAVTAPTILPNGGTFHGTLACQTKDATSCILWMVLILSQTPTPLLHIIQILLILHRQ